MLAFAMMAAIRHHANAAPPPKRMRKTQTDPLIGSEKPSHRQPPRAAANPTRARHCLVTLATSSSGQRTTRTYQIKNATVMLACLC
ncbi:hypothetical protein BW45_22350 [Agrobacterium tumefaciens]|nr:hypothetical protein BW45_22350 [Agrobacterium tumefaciens]